MTRTTSNFVVDTIAFAAFVLLAATGLVERYLLPPGSGHFQSLWGLNRHQWGEIHFWIALALMAALAMHIVLHWKWIISVLRGRKSDASGQRVVLGALGVVGLVALSLAPFLSPVQQTSEVGRRQNIERQGTSPPAGTDVNHDEAIRGSMTLDEIEQLTGVSATVILRELDLPTDTLTNSQLGRLRRRYGFQMSDVRKTVEAHQQ